MFEIPFVSKESLNEDSIEWAQRHSARFAQLQDMADKMSQAEWCVEWTITGLAFLPRTKDWYERDPAAARKLLDALGILDPFRKRCSRSLVEILGARVEYQDRSWYAEAQESLQMLVDVDYPSWQTQQDILETVADMVEKEARYPRRELVVDSDYERGILQGRRQALEWLFGKEWPAVEAEEDEWEAEDAQEERDFANQERAIEGFQELLFDGQEKEPATADAVPGKDEARPVSIEMRGDAEK